MAFLQQHQQQHPQHQQNTGLNAMYAATTCETPLMYRATLQELAPPATQAAPAQLYQHQQDVKPSIVTSTYPPQYWPSQPAPMPQAATYSTYPPLGVMAPSPLQPQHMLYPPTVQGTRHSRSHSASSTMGLELPPDAALAPTSSPQLTARSLSPGATSPDLRAYGFPNANGTWSCAFPGCTSRAVFTRGCDLRKHHKRHTKSFFCRHEGCPQAVGGGFSSRKDLARHEAKHNPGVLCEWDSCGRIFSRVDNMVCCTGSNRAQRVVANANAA